MIDYPESKRCVIMNRKTSLDVRGALMGEAIKLESTVAVEQERLKEIKVVSQQTLKKAIKR